MERTCRKCGETKPIEEFTKNKRCKYGRENLCSKCKNLYNYIEVNIIRNKEYRKKYYIENKEKLHNSYKNNYLLNRDIYLNRSKEYYQLNKNKVSEYSKLYYKSLPEYQMEKRKIYRESHRQEKSQTEKTRRDYNKKSFNDTYVCKTLTSKGIISTHIIRQYPELIEAKRIQLKLKKLINENSNKP